MNKKRVCLIGNPNVGKSSVFNALTHQSQHTGNWTGKTVSNAIGEFCYKNTVWEVIDLPGTYSLVGESEEEKIASKFIQEKNYDVAIILADATNLERSIIILFEVLSVTKKVILGINLIDEADKRNIKINYPLLQRRLNIPVIPMSIKEDIGLKELVDAMNQSEFTNIYQMSYSKIFHQYFEWMQGVTLEKCKEVDYLLALNDFDYAKEIIIDENNLKLFGYWQKRINKIQIMNNILDNCNQVMENVVYRDEEIEKKEDMFWNKLLTNKITSFFCMIILLFVVLWITIFFSNYPSKLLFQFFQYFEPFFLNIFSFLPVFIRDMLIYGGYRTLYWVTSVMLPPMMIFFPLFSLLEDYGFLPRIAFNVDKPFSKCGSCGKQGLTMCMGLGCNAVGVTGTRIMENKKMRILSILTNVFMPCNGRFPAMITLIHIFLVSDTNFGSSILSAFILLGFILLGILLTFMITYLLNKTILKNEKTIFIMELPSFRKPKIIKSCLFAWKEKALSVLKRAVVVSFPAGIIIYLLANIYISNLSIMEHIILLIDPFGRLVGLDGTILFSFLLGMPANEIVLPVLLLGYKGSGVIAEYASIDVLKQILIMNHWNVITGINFLILMLCHFPCATTLLTIKKETNSWFYTSLAFIIPTITGLFLCFLLHILF